MEYTIIDTDNLDKLARDVAERIEEGWKPQGGVAIAGWIQESGFTVKQ